MKPQNTKHNSAWQRWAWYQWKERRLNALLKQWLRIKQLWNRRRIRQTAAALLLAGGMLASPIIYAAGEIFTVTIGASNPLNGVSGITYSTPNFVDIDNDGDMDMFIGGFGGTLKYYKNTGTALAPSFAEQTGVSNPFNGVIMGSYIIPSFVDVDGDGDMDVFIGEQYSIKYYKNTGTAANPTFLSQTGSNNPFNGATVGFNNTPSFVDIDGDGDMDALIGDNLGTISYYKNTGTPLAPTFTAQTGTANLFNGVDVGTYSTPNFVDIDGDGDMDAFIGEAGGTVKLYKNTGTVTSPTFTAITGDGNRFNGLSVGSRIVPDFVDIDGDGDMDAFIGEVGGTIKYYKNTGTNSYDQNTPTVQTGASNPLNGASVTANSMSVLVDIDGDGDMDAFIGEAGGTIKYYKNTGTALNPSFTVQTGVANPLNGVSVGANSTPYFVDIDGDGDMDSFIGESGGTIKYYKNTGTTLSPSFAVQTGVANPLNGVSGITFSTPSFVDVDSDGDMDAFIGESGGTIKYYKNTGTALSPSFAVQSGATNPLNGVTGITSSVPSFVDTDNDGDMDAFIGESGGTIKYYKNTGTALSPSFAVQSGTANPFNGATVGVASTPRFVDIDGDGDMDAFIGESGGTIKFYENSNCTFSTETDSTLAAGDVIHFGNGNSRVSVQINTLGTLSSLQVTCNTGNHANAKPQIQTGVNWTITPIGSGYDLNLTLPFKNPTVSADKACRYTGSNWDCAVTSNSSTDLTRNNVTVLSDWAVGQNASATAITLSSFSTESRVKQGGLLAIVGATITLLLGLVWRVRKLFL